MHFFWNDEMHNMYSILTPITYWLLSKNTGLSVFLFEILSDFRKDIAACVSLSFINNVKEPGGYPPPTKRASKSAGTL